MYLDYGTTLPSFIREGLYGIVSNINVFIAKRLILIVCKTNCTRVVPSNSQRRGTLITKKISLKSSNSYNSYKHFVLHKSPICSAPQVYLAMINVICGHKLIFARQHLKTYLLVELRGTRHSPHLASLYPCNSVPSRPLALTNPAFWVLHQYHRISLTADHCDSLG